MKFRPRQTAAFVAALIAVASMPFVIWLAYLTGVIKPFGWALRWF